MSNGDDVLDNWEEIDEAGLKSTVQKLKTTTASNCERITTNSQLNSSSNTTTTTATRPTQMKLLQRSTNPDSSSSKPSPLDDMSSTFQPVLMVLHKPVDEYESANYTPPIANQTVKILRRPTQSTEPRNNGIRPKQPIKTLQQREQEYAEARLRILGSAKNPEDEEQRAASANNTTTVTTSITDSTPSTPITITPITITAPTLTLNTSINVAATAKINSPKIQGGPNLYNNQFNQQQQQQLQQQQQYQQNYQQQQQQQQQNFFYNQQQPQSPAYNNNNRTFNMPPLLGLGPMGAIGQPAQYQATTSPSPQTQQHLKYQQYHQKSSPKQQQHQTWSPVVGGSVSSSSLRQQQQQQNETILRSPRGPDGSTGFQMRR